MLADKEKLLQRGQQGKQRVQCAQVVDAGAAKTAADALAASKKQLQHDLLSKRDCKPPCSGATKCVQKQQGFA
jgi:hypothetical protein